MADTNIVFLTGAGISAESGISTFRDEGGTWANHNIADVATPEAFARNPDLVQDFYNARRAQLQTVEPNAAHKALGRLVEHFSQGTVTVVTQNVDDLHERGGVFDTVHMHGELKRIRCVHCGFVGDIDSDCTQETRCPKCLKVPALRPHIVWFGEMPFYMNQIEDALAEADLFVSIGTSGNVYPASGFVAAARQMGRAYTLELNLEPSEGVSLFHEARQGKASTLVPELVDSLLSGQFPGLCSP